MKKLLIIGLTILASSTLYAEDKLDWSLCEKEVKEFQCEGSDKDIWSCLEKHDDKLSESCQKTHVKGDALFKKK